MWGWCWNCVALPTIKATCLRKPQHVFHKPSGMVKSAACMSTTQIFFTEHLILLIPAHQHCIALLLSLFFLFFSSPKNNFLPLSCLAHLRAVPVNVQRHAYKRSAAEDMMVSAGSLQLCSPHGAPIFSSPRALSPAHTLKLGEKWAVLGLMDCCCCGAL